MATLGIVLLDCDHLAPGPLTFDPTHHRGLGVLPAGFFECPATWPVPTSYVVAPAATPAATLRGEPAALDGLREAIDVLTPRSDLVITNCGFFWAARSSPRRYSGAVLVSGFDLLDLAGIMTRAPIGILTYSAERAAELLRSHPLVPRLRIVGVDDCPAWSVLTRDDWVTAGGWTQEDLGRELLAVANHELTAGSLRDVGILLLECTAMPQFREQVRRITTVPILDLASVAADALT